MKKGENRDGGLMTTSMRYNMIWYVKALEKKKKETPPITLYTIAGQPVLPVSSSSDLGHTLYLEKRTGYCAAFRISSPTLFPSSTRRTGLLLSVSLLTSRCREQDLKYLRISSLWHLRERIRYMYCGGK